MRKRLSLSEFAFDRRITGKNFSEPETSTICAFKSRIKAGIKKDDGKT